MGLEVHAGLGACRDAPPDRRLCRRAWTLWATSVKELDA